MDRLNPDSQIVTLMLRTADGGCWPLTLAADCLCFIGRYRRVDGFEIDAALTVGGMRKAG